MSPFQWIDHIVKSKTPYSKFSLEDWKTFNIFLINRTLSMNPSYLEIVDYVSGLGLENKEKIYRIYCDIIPKSNKTFYPYIKSQTQNPNKEALKYISDYYMCGVNKANEYMELMGEEEFKKFLEQYGIEKKEINKLLK